MDHETFSSLKEHDRVKKWDAGEWIFGEIVKQRGETFWVKRDGGSGFFTLSFIDIEQSEKLRGILYPDAPLLLATLVRIPRLRKQRSPPRRSDGLPRP